MERWADRSPAEASALAADGALGRCAPCFTCRALASAELELLLFGFTMSKSLADTRLGQLQS